MTLPFPFLSFQLVCRAVSVVVLNSLSLAIIPARFFSFVILSILVAFSIIVLASLPPLSLQVRLGVV